MRPLNSIVAVIVVCSFFLLGGCLDTRSPERLTYIQGIGFDYEDGEFTAYVQLVNLSGLAAKREGGGSEGGLPLVVGKEKGKTLDEAIFKMYRSAIAEVYWGNLSFIIVTERLLQAQEFMSVIDMWSRFPEARYQIYLYSTSEDLEKVLEVNPILDIAKGMGGLAFPENNYRQYSFVSLTKLRNILILLKEPNYLGYIPSVSLPDGLWKNPEDKKPKNIEIQGMSLYDRDKGFLGTLKDERIIGYRWVTKDFRRAEIPIVEDEEAVASLVVNNKKTKVEPIPTESGVTFEMNIEIEAHVAELHEQKGYLTLEKLAEKKVKEDVLTTYREALQLDKDADIYRLSEKLYRKDIRAWKKLAKEGKLDLNEDSLQVKVEVKIKDSWRDHMRRRVE